MPLAPAGLLLAALAAAPPLVDAGAALPGAVLDLRYAGPRNPAGRPLYPAARCLLLGPVADRLARASAALAARGLRLVIWDCYRPLSVQRELWSLRPDRRYVADPARGSNHNRGAAVDVSLADAGGAPLPMPTDHDAFEVRARPGAADGLSPVQLANRATLRAAMEEAGFAQNRGEWWHYDAPEARGAPLLDLPLDGAHSR
ncbi:MAG: M15 family metallopeptidase [Deltaproteobacteria bacterium]|nr:M15 family metallopeptidase [Deltaproteobacteria bacterium]